MTSKWIGGKGSKQRPVNRQKFADNWDAIFGKKKEVVEEVLDTYNNERLVSKFDKELPTVAFNSHGAHAQDRNVFHVDVGELPVDEAIKFIEENIKTLDSNNK
jgi:hypothetical protein